MAIQIRVFRDVDGRLRAEASPPHQHLPNFLTTDVGTLADNARGLLRAIAQVRAGEAAELGGVGNAWDVSITPGGVTIENVYVDEYVVRLSLDDFETALKAWLAQLGPSA